jgi:alpha-tubulin suppressor-like RCC1 family protein
LKDDGTVWSWCAGGINDHGQLGDGTTNRNTPAQIAGLSNIVSIEVGYMHCMALSATGDVYAWGFNQMGQLGNGTNADQLAPVLISGLKNITLINTGDYNSFAKDADGNIYSWGYNSDGQLGFGNRDNTNTPAVLFDKAIGAHIVVITGGRSNTSIALKDDGTD